MKISIGCDHAGFILKEKIIQFLSTMVEEIIDFGTNSSDSVDYPDYAHAVAISIIEEKADIGILLCGTANGVSMTANKWQGIRCALCWNSDIAELSRLHNNANILSIPARFISDEEAFLIVKKFLDTKFEGGRHLNRINKINSSLI